MCVALQLLPELIVEAIPALLGTLARLEAPAGETIRQLQKVRRSSRRMCSSIEHMRLLPIVEKLRETYRERGSGGDRERTFVTDQSDVFFPFLFPL